jgi:hypothetical protein
MKSVSALSVVVCVCLTACATLPPAYEPHTPDEQAIVGLFQTIESGYNTGKVEKQISPSTPDARIASFLVEGRTVSASSMLPFCGLRPAGSPL